MGAFNSERWGYPLQKPGRAVFAAASASAAAILLCCCHRIVNPYNFGASQGWLLHAYVSMGGGVIIDTDYPYVLNVHTVSGNLRSTHNFRQTLAKYLGLAMHRVMNNRKVRRGIFFNPRLLLHEYAVTVYRYTYAYLYLNSYYRVEGN